MISKEVQFRQVSLYIQIKGLLYYKYNVITQVGLFIDNIVKENGESNGYNKYRPMKNPIENGCIDKPGDCEDDCVSINRLTGMCLMSYLNRWIDNYIIDCLFV